MGVQLDEVEVEEFLTNGHTLILGTTRKSGEPFLTTLWYGFANDAIYFRTPAKSAKVQHIKRNSQVCCMVEDGERWIDLRAVVLSCNAELVENDSAEALEVDALIAHKYAAFRPKLKAAPKTTKKHYSGSNALVKLTPKEGEIRSWYNRKIRGVEEMV
jgi:nitroimidazol reductase NimA-like FMN-containing flavoprotein (pyridoxamine 5'-phosphate oxidase superfamily)